MSLRRQPENLDEDESDSAAVWMISFSDLLTVLLAMFVMRFSMSTFKPHALDKVLPNSAVEEQPAKASSAALVEALAPALGTRLPLSTPDKIQFEDQIEIEAVKEGALISLGGDTFQPGSRELSPIVQEKIRQIGEVLRSADYEVIVAGHSDDIPIHTEIYASNWELSAARAIEVAEILMPMGVVGSRISAVGYADTKPLVANDSPEGRQRNRRVEILIRRHDQAALPDLGASSLSLGSGATPKHSAAANSVEEKG